jgi:hypothetical protein
MVVSYFISGWKQISRRRCHRPDLYRAAHTTVIDSGEFRNHHCPFLACHGNRVSIATEFFFDHYGLDNHNEFSIYYERTKSGN